jgi:hypothetical protein
MVVRPSMLCAATSDDVRERFFDKRRVLLQLITMENLPADTFMLIKVERRETSNAFPLR